MSITTFEGSPQADLDASMLQAAALAGAEDGFDEVMEDWAQTAGTTRIKAVNARYFM
jgi:hypothetical protein